MSRFVYFFGFVLAAFLALGMFQAKSGANSSRAEIENLEKGIASLKSDISILQKEHDALSNRDRIARLAAQRLGMGPARSYQMLEVERAADVFGPLVEYDPALETGGGGE